MRLLLANSESRDGRLLPFIFTGTVAARKALREVSHRFAASGLDPRRHPGALAAMSSTPQPATRNPLPNPVPDSACVPVTKRPFTAQPRAPLSSPLLKSVMHVASNPHDL
jgi:hypothetical protein